MLYKLTRFDNVRSTTGQPLELSLESLAELLTAAPLVNTSNKLDAPAFTPGWYTDNVRNKQGFQGASCLVLDVDGPDHGALSDSQLLSILEFLKNRDLMYIVYTTYNAGLRVVFPLESEVTSKEYTDLYDQLDREFPVALDRTGRTAERLAFLPQVPDHIAAARHLAEAQLEGRLLSPSPAQKPAPNTGVFSGLKLSGVKIGRLVTNLTELTSALSGSENKQEDLNKFCFGLACDAARRAEDKQTFALAMWAAAEAGLRANPRPVENWKLALDTCERAVEQGYQRVESERNEAYEQIPPAVLKTVARLVNEGDLSGAGHALGKFSNNVLTPAVLTGELVELVESSDGVVSVPDALAELRGAIEESARFEWQTGLSLDQKGNFDGTDRNIDIVLREHPEVRGRLVRNVRSVQGRAYADDMPWGSGVGPVENVEADHNRFFMWVTSDDVLGRGAAGMPAIKARARLDAAFDETPEYDPFLEYLKSLTWDGKQRLGSWFADIGGESSEYAKLVCRKFLIGAVARAYRPGCEVDNVLVLVGGQGKGKSRTLRALCPEYSGTLTSLTEREVPQRMSRWVVAIIDEIERWGTKKASGELKEFVTAVSAESRKAYGRSDKVYLRRAVLAGATNHDDFLYDETGARRWWKVDVADMLDVAKLEEMRDQLWAEAVRAYLGGEVWWLSRNEQKTLAEPKQENLTTDASPESQHLLDTMNYCPPAMRCKVREPIGMRNGRIPVTDDQAVGDKLPWITLSQASAILHAGGFRNDNRTVKDAIRLAKLKRNKSTDRYSLCGTL